MAQTRGGCLAQRLVFGRGGKLNKLHIHSPIQRLVGRLARLAEPLDDLGEAGPTSRADAVPLYLYFREVIRKHMDSQEADLDHFEAGVARAAVTGPAPSGAGV
mgnify:CR=1 FL=1